MFRRHVRDVHRFVRRRTGDDALADDLTAVTFERCWAALPGFQAHHTTMLPWLLRIAANALATHFRSESRRRTREHAVAVREVPDRTIDAPDPLAEDDVLVALGALALRHQEVLTLRFLADLSTEEAAAALGIGRGHFAVLQHRALAALRRHLDEEGQHG